MYIYAYIYGRDGGLSSLCNGCRFDYQQRVLKALSGAANLHSEDGLV